MPTKDPNAWAMLWAVLAAWLNEHWPTLYGLLLSLTIAWLRITYNGGNGRRRTLETLLCGAIALMVISALDWIGVPGSASGFVGGMVGFLGVEAIRDMAVKLLNKKVETT